MRQTLLLSLSLVVAAGCSCGGERTVLIDLYTDYRPVGDFGTVRVEVKDTPFDAPGRVASLDNHRADAGLSYVDGVRVATIGVAHCERFYVRLTLVDGAGRRRARRVVEVPDDCASRAIRVDLSRACQGVSCPSAGGDPEATECRAGACVRPTCDADAGPCAGQCEVDGDCPASSLPCESPRCSEVGCLMADDCGDREYCATGGCAALPECGDGACGPGVESPCGCPADCGACPDGCGDGTCAAGEDAASCPEDCSPDEPTCGDGVCELLESCPSDCGAGRCGDEVCEASESCATCADCCPGPCGDVDCGDGCGDGVCAAGELECPQDCGPTIECGDMRCDAGEACPADCDGAPVCGDDACTTGESCGSESCQLDCGWCQGFPQIPPTASCLGAVSGGDGATCGDVPGAFTSAAVNLAYYPMFVGRSDPDYVDAAMGRTGVGLYSGENHFIRDLPVTTRFAVQSTRNPTCIDAPPMRPSVSGWVFGYTPDGDTLEGSVGWVRAEFLTLHDSDADSCADGPQGRSFQMRTNPYSRPVACEPLGCSGPARSCRDANPIGEGAGECGGARVDRPMRVTGETVWLRYSAGGPPRRVLHAGDEIRVRYEDASGWYFARVVSSSDPVLNAPGHFGWVQSMYVADR